jgi:hypothetical protein
MNRGSQPQNPGRLRGSRVARTAISNGAWLLGTSIVVRGTFLGRCVVVDPAR